MISDFRFEKGKNNEQGGYETMKLKLQTIMETLQAQKQQFSKLYQQKIRHYQSQLKCKDSLIEQLSIKLQESNIKLEKAQEQSQTYKEVVSQLKQQFFKMVSVVNHINLPKPTKELKRVKSDYIEKAFNKIDLNRQISAPSQPYKFDINTYFQKIKASTIQADKAEADYVNLKETFASSDNFSRISVATRKLKSPEPCLQDGTTVLSSKYQSTKTTTRWGHKRSNNYNSKQNHVRIRQYKQNQWQQTF